MEDNPKEIPKEVLEEEAYADTIESQWKKWEDELKEDIPTKIKKKAKNGK